MDSKQPGFPTSPHYTPVSTPTGASQTLDTTTGQMGVCSVADTPVSATVVGDKRPSEPGDNPELPDRKVAKTEPASPTAIPTPTMGDLYNLMVTQNAILATQWAIQQLQRGSSGFSSKLLPLPPQPNPPMLSQLLQQAVKTENLPPPVNYPSPLLSDLPPATSHKVPDWLKNLPSTPMERKRSVPSSFDDAIAVVGEGPKKAKVTGKKKTVPQKKRPGKDYRKEFEGWAESLTRMFPKHPVDARGLWGLCESTPAAAGEQYLGSEKFDGLPSETRAKLSDIFYKARTARKNAKAKGITPLSWTDSKKPHASSPVPSSILSDQSGDTGYGTMVSSLSQQSPTVETGPTAALSLVPKTPLTRAVLSNPHKNRCFINATIHYLKAVLSSEDQARLINLAYLPETSQAKYDSSVIAFARLYQAMEKFEGGTAGSEQQVLHALDVLVLACLEHPAFKHCVGLKAKRKTRADTNSPTLPDQQLRLLEHNDAAEFYMAVWTQLRHLIPSMKQVSLYQEMQTTHKGQVFTKQTQLDEKTENNDGCEPFLAIKFKEGMGLQTAINHFFATVQPNPRTPGDQIDWESQPQAMGSDIRLPKGRYPTSKTYRLGTRGPLKNFHLRLELQTATSQGVQQKIPSVCIGLRESVFNDIRVPVDDIDTGMRRTENATPVCIIAHTGDDLHSGHYVTLEKTELGWLLHDDGELPTLLDDPAGYLQSAPYFDPYLVAYDTV